MAANALKKINARVKHLAKLHPGKARKTLQKQAGAEYRAGKLGGVKKTHKKTARKKTIRKIKKLHNLEGRAIHALHGVRSTFQAAAIGGLTTAQHIAHAKHKLKHEIGVAEAHKFATAKKSAKRKISKRIALLKSKYRKLC